MLNRPLPLAILAAGLVPLAASAVAARAQAADPGVTPTEILLGAAMPLTGALARTGLEQRVGTQVAIDEVNSHGGVNGRQLRIQIEDDAYDPAKTVEATQKLIHGDKVFALLNYNGTPNAKAALPMVTSEKVPLLFPKTGDVITRLPGSPNVVNLRASYYDEADALINELCGKRKLCRIAVLEQKDGFGHAIGTVTVHALNDRQLKPVGRAEVARGATDLKGAFEQLAKLDPQAVVLGTSAASAIPFANAVQEAGKGWTLVGFDNNSTMAEKVTGDARMPILMAQVVPDPMSPRLAAAKSFRNAMKGAGHEDLETYISFEMYLNGRVLAQALAEAGKEPTRDGLRAAFRNHEYKVDDLTVKFGADTSKGALPVHLVQLIGRELKPL